MARTRQPQWPASVNWSHPSTRSLIAAAYPVGAGLWLANKGTLHFAQSVSLNTGVTTYGRTVYGPNENVTNFIPLFIPLASDTFAAPVTMLAAIQPIGGGNAACTICSFGSGSSNGRIALQYGAVDLGNQYLRLVSSATAVLATDTFPAFSGANGVGSPEIVAATYAGTSAGYSFWHNGSKSSSGTTASTSALFDGFGALDSSTYPSYQGYTRLAGIFCWSRILSDDELQSLTTNPWQLFATPRRLWIQLGAATGAGQSAAATVAATASATGGASTAASATAAATVVASSSALAGAATGTASGTATGATVVANASIIAGSATGNAAGTANGAIVAASVGAIAGAMNANAEASGQTVTVATSAIAGALQADYVATGAVAAASATAIPGAVATGTGATAFGATATATVTYLSGAIAAASSAAGWTQIVIAIAARGVAYGALPDIDPRYLVPSRNRRFMAQARGRRFNART